MMKNIFDLQLFANISNSNSDTVITGTSDADSIYNEGKNATIDGGAGDDTITNYGSFYFLYGGEDAYREKGGNYSSINGGVGNDVVSISGAIGTDISGGIGDDTIYTTSTLFYQYKNGDGNDVVIFENNEYYVEQLYISENSYSTQISGEDFIVNVGDGKITFKDTSNVPNIYGHYDVSELVQDGVEVVTLSGSNSRDKVYYDGTSKKIISNFSAGKGDHSDVIVITGGTLENIQRSEHGTITLNMTNGNYIHLRTDSTDSDDIILYSADGQNIFGAKIALESENRLLYDDAVNYYQLSQRGEIFGWESNFPTNASIWLDGSQGKFFVNVASIDARYASHDDIFVGDGESNYIWGGRGNSSMWGGSGGNDTLAGYEGRNMFWFGKNDGADFFKWSENQDLINLYDVNLSDIVSDDVNSAGISLAFNTGSNLYVEATTYQTTNYYRGSSTTSQNFWSGRSSTFQLADGSKWQYDFSTSEWQSA